MSVSEGAAAQLCALVVDDPSSESESESGGQRRWDARVSPLSLPDGMELLMADVCGGSESPSMARKVLAWKRKASAETREGPVPWDQLLVTNSTVESVFSRDVHSPLVKIGLEKYGASVFSKRLGDRRRRGEDDDDESDGEDRGCWADLLRGPPPNSDARFDPSSSDVDALRSAAVTLLDLRRAFVQARRNLKAMGEAAGGAGDDIVPVEPDSQTRLADATMALPGVVAAGVPGAGGYDALFVLYVKGRPTAGGTSDAVRDSIGELWRNWGSSGSKDAHGGETTAPAAGDDGGGVVCPLAVRCGGHGREQGLREENQLQWD
uniref:Uncharacterized protein n=1 Tax=Odontella aurita TaxID=265563 RepID=A0A6U6ERV9_9STRA|mmetsp:Transcript_29083/g.86083  ORF Transcript_29083/g.86083 Transcript_29083/m.86083 type:complete len:321 (+) Transcript_29083:587-1549(+)